VRICWRQLCDDIWEAVLGRCFGGNLLRIFRSSCVNIFGRESCEDI